MEKVEFIANSYDGYLTKIAVREANIIVQSNNDKELIDRMRNLISICHEIDVCGGDTEDNRNIILNELTELCTRGYLTPLTLKDNEFDSYGINIRDKHIIKNDKGIYNNNAYRIQCKRYYDVFTNREYNSINDILYSYNITNIDININAGGVFTGETIIGCKIKQSFIDNQSYIPEKPIIIPCSGIKLKDDRIIFTVDKREPTLKILHKIYDVETSYDVYAKSYFDIRKFKKLNK